MVRDDIFGGLKSALARGQSLKQAMMSFYNSGYPKAEVDEAANALKEEGVSVGQIQQPQQIQYAAKSQTSQKNFSSPMAQKVSLYGGQPVQILQPGLQRPVFVQAVSAYEQPCKAPGKAVIFILVFLLLMLVGALTAVFFFKEEIIAFFSA